MEGRRQPLLLLWLASLVAITIYGSNAEVVEEDTLQVKNLSVIPHSCNGSSVTKLVIEESLVTLNETDRQALASYPRLVELHLDGNLVTRIPAKYFSVVPQLRVLSLSRNKISSLDPDSFSGLEVLTELDLSYNLLTSLQSQLFRGLTNLQVLKLQGNPWNCSCPLSSTGEVKAAGLTRGREQIPCVSPETLAGKDLLQATAMCSPSPPPSIFTTDPQKPGTSQSSWGKEKHILNKDSTPVLANTWKFAAYVAALALSTFVLIVCAIKGPSFYKLFHNYRHRRLLQEEEEDGVSTVFSETGRYMNHQTFTFKQENGQREEEEEEEEEEDGYFEDPYVRSEEYRAGGETSAQP